MGSHAFVVVAALDLAHGFHLLTVFLGLIVLLPVLVQTVMTLDGWLFRQRLTGSAFLKHLDEPLMGLVAMLAFGVLLPAEIALFSLRHLMKFS